MNKANNAIRALGFATPEKRNEKFMTTPKNAAAVVKHPKINPSPIKTSPHGTNTLNKATFGRATPFKNDAHQASTPGFFTAPCRNQKRQILQLLFAIHV